MCLAEVRSRRFFFISDVAPLASPTVNNLWATFLGPSGPSSVLSALAGVGGVPGLDGPVHVKEEGAQENPRSGRGLGVGALGMLEDGGISPPMSSRSMTGIMDASAASLGGPLSSIFPEMFQSNANGKGGGSGVTPPQSTDRCAWRQRASTRVKYPVLVCRRKAPHDACGLRTSGLDGTERTCR